MKQLLCGAAVAAGLCLVAGAANAVTYTEVDYNGSNQAPLFGTPAPLTSTPKFDLIQSGTDSGVERSPYETNTDTTTAYSVLAKGGQAGPATATYGISNTATSFEILWGSPDSYNTVEFFTSSDGSGSAFYSVSGNSLTCTQTGHACLDTDGTTPIGWADVTFTFNGDKVGSVVLVVAGQAAFEYGLNTAGIIPGPTPLPAALPLFGTVLGGGLLFGRMRKRRKA